MVEYLERSGKPRLAYIYTAPRDESLPFVLFCGGYRSDMQGTKAGFLEESCRARGQGFLRFDYRGHGVSAGDFMDGTIGLWFEDAKDMFALIPPDKNVIVIGSSMGGWIMLLLALAYPERVTALIGIAPAPDFTRWIESGLTPAQHEQMARLGYVEEPNEYSPEPYRFTRAFLDEARTRFIMDAPIPFTGPVRILQGKRDTAVDWTHAGKIEKALVSADCAVTLIDDGDHSLSRPQDLALLDKSLVDLTGGI